MSTPETGSGTQQAAPAGWYENAQWSGERYWDGTRWTDTYRASPQVQAPGQAQAQAAPAGWYQNPQWPGERYYDGAQWTDDYRQPPWIQVKLKGPYAWGGSAYVVPAVCCACGAPAGAAKLDKRNTDAGHVFSTYAFPLCDRCAAIHAQHGPGLFGSHEEKEAWKARKDEWERVDDAVKYRFDSRGDKATFSFRNRTFADAFQAVNADSATKGAAAPAAAEATIQLVQAEQVSPADAAALEQREQAQSAAAIAIQEPPDINAWAAALESPDWEVRREAAVALGRVGDLRGIQLLSTVIAGAEGEPAPTAPSEQRVDATIALTRVMLEPGERILESSLDINAGVQLQALLAGETDDAVRSAASWGLSRVPRVGAPGDDMLPIGHLTRWHMVRMAEALRAGRIQLPEETTTQIMEFVGEIEAEQPGGDDAAGHDGPAQRDPAAQAERAQLLTQAGLHQSAVSCSTCGDRLWQHPTGALGSSLLGNVCLGCNKVFCDQCIQVGGPTPCPDCGTPTEPAGKFELAKIGITLADE